MSVRNNAPYKDAFLEDGTSLIYEGHDVPRNAGVSEPKRTDQQEFKSNGNRTQNGLFHKAAQDFKAGAIEAEYVRVYEKMRDGIWANNGLFRLIDSWIEHDGIRNVFKFRLSLSGDTLLNNPGNVIADALPSRLIPTSVKQAVWKRDGGKCVQCGATTELHFDHIIPFSKGGTSLLSDNIQLLCAKHNLGKRDRIE
jgi:hypothetical protein